MQSNKEGFAYKLKQLEAENEVLRKAAAMKENIAPDILQPPKGVSGRQYNLQSAMGLENNDELYGALRRCVRDLGTKAGLNYAIIWHRQPKDLIAKVVGALL